MAHLFQRRVQLGADRRVVQAGHAPDQVPAGGGEDVQPGEPLAAPGRAVDLQQDGAQLARAVDAVAAARGVGLRVVAAQRAFDQRGRAQPQLQVGGDGVHVPLARLELGEVRRVERGLGGAVVQRLGLGRRHAVELGPVGVAHVRLLRPFVAEVAVVFIVSQHLDAAVRQGDAVLVVVNRGRARSAQVIGLLVMGPHHRLLQRALEGGDARAGGLLELVAHALGVLLLQPARVGDRGGEVVQAEFLRDADGVLAGEHGPLALDQEAPHALQARAVPVAVARLHHRHRVGPARGNHGGPAGRVREVHAFAVRVVVAPLALARRAAQEAEVLLVAHVLHAGAAERGELHHLGVELRGIAGVLLGRVALGPAGDVEALHEGVRRLVDPLAEVVVLDRVGVEHKVQRGERAHVADPHQAHVGAPLVGSAGGLGPGRPGGVDVDLREVALGMHHVGQPLGRADAGGLGADVEVARAQHAQAIAGGLQGHAAGRGLQRAAGRQGVEHSVAFGRGAVGGGVAGEQDRQAAAGAFGARGGVGHGLAL